MEPSSPEERQRAYRRAATATGVMAVAFGLVGFVRSDSTQIVLACLAAIAAAYFVIRYLRNP